MKAALRITAQVLASVLLTGALGGVASIFSMRRSMSDAPDPAFTPHGTPPALDPARPLVVIVLGDTQSDVTDVLGPYALFTESKEYDVNLVASSRAVRTLSGGLEVAPQRTFEEILALRPSGPALVVTPAIAEIGSARNAPVREFVRRMQQSATLFSWCTGAEVLAASGVADGRELTAHWGDLGRLEEAYPRVSWRRGVRYIDGRTIVSAAGLLSGIDATLHLLAQRNGAAVAQRVASALHLPSSSFVAAPTMPAYRFDARDAIYLFNAAFYWPKKTSGVLLLNGVGELDLAALFDTYPASWTDAALTLASERTVTSRHGLTLVARAIVRPPATALPPLDRLFIPARSAQEHLAPELLTELRERHVPIRELGDEGVDPFRRVLEHLAQDEGVAVAGFATKRLEYRAPSLRLVGALLPIRPFVAALVTALLATAAVLWVSRVLRRHSRRARAASLSRDQSGTRS